MFLSQWFPPTSLLFFFPLKKKKEGNKFTILGENKYEVLLHMRDDIFDTPLDESKA